MRSKLKFEVETIALKKFPEEKSEEHRMIPPLFIPFFFCKNCAQAPSFTSSLDEKVFTRSPAASTQRCFNVHFELYGCYGR